MGSGKSYLYSGTKGSSSVLVVTPAQNKEKYKQAAEKRKETIRKKLEAVKSLFENGKIKLDRIQSHPDFLKEVTPNQWVKVLKEMGYEGVSKCNAAHSTSGAILIKIERQGNGHNINQIQFSPGGGRHGDSPYIKISTTDQGKIKIVFGKESDYRHEGNERATIIFTEDET